MGPPSRSAHCPLFGAQVLDSDGRGELGYEDVREGLRKMRVTPVMHLSQVRHYPPPLLLM
jgi:hypothetical protein